MKDYRCKDCEWWKEYGAVCTYAIDKFVVTYRPADSKKCKHFKLKK